MDNESTTSLNKYISQSGLCSRRAADQMIDEGRVMLNDQVAKKGNRVAEGDVVTVDGVPIQIEIKHVYIALNKPIGIVCTSDRTIPNNIIDYIDFPQRIFPIGRIDQMSQGLILLTSDGDIVNGILRTRYQKEKEYSVEVDKEIDDIFIKTMSSGVPILDTMTQPCKVRRVGDRSFTIILTQGLNRQIRRMCEVLGYEVKKLERTRIMHITLDGLPNGKWRYLSEKEVSFLKK